MLPPSFLGIHFNSPELAAGVIIVDTSEAVKQQYISLKLRPVRAAPSSSIVCWFNWPRSTSFLSLCLHSPCSSPCSDPLGLGSLNFQFLVQLSTFLEIIINVFKRMVVVYQQRQHLEKTFQKKKNIKTPNCKFFEITYCGWFTDTLLLIY